MRIDEPDEDESDELVDCVRAVLLDTDVDAKCQTMAELVARTLRQKYTLTPIETETK